MKNLSQMMKQAQELQTKMQEMQTRLEGTEITGQSGAGMVEVTLNGKGEMRGLKLDKSIVDPEDTEVLEDLIVAAYNDAKVKVEAAAGNAGKSGGTPNRRPVRCRHGQGDAQWQRRNARPFAG